MEETTTTGVLTNVAFAKFSPDCDTSLSLNQSNPEICAFPLTSTQSNTAPIKSMPEKLSDDSIKPVGASPGLSVESVDFKETVGRSGEEKHTDVIPGISDISGISNVSNTSTPDDLGTEKNAPGFENVPESDSEHENQGFENLESEASHDHAFINVDNLTFRRGKKKKTKTRIKTDTCANGSMNGAEDDSVLELSSGPCTDWPLRKVSFVSSASPSPHPPPSTYSTARGLDPFDMDCSFDPFASPTPSPCQPLDLSMRPATIAKVGSSPPFSSPRLGTDPHNNNNNNSINNGIFRQVSKNLNEISSLKMSLAALENKLLIKIKGAKSDTDDRVVALDRQMDGAFGYVDARMDAIFMDKIREIDSHLSETVEMINAKVEKKLVKLEVAVAKQLSQFQEHMEKNFEKNPAKYSGKEDFEKNFRENFDKKLESADFNATLVEMVENHLTKKEVDLEALFSYEAFARSEKQVESITNAFLIKHESLQEELNDFKSTVTFLSSTDVIPSKTCPTSIELEEIRKKLSAQSSLLSSLQTEIRANKKLLGGLELKSRDLNLIIDGFEEIPNEDTLTYVIALLSKFIPGLERQMIDNAYRLGSFQQKGTPRRILLIVTSSFARNLILNSADRIANAGLPGARVFINEDIPETMKRRRQDIYKYVNFLNEQGIEATQKGDGVRFNNTLYNYEEILNMPDGFSLKDSRTKHKNGVISFQSQFSPLSNLFIAPLKRNGIVYRSSEHAYQHAKAIHGKDYALARSILDEPCPYEAMAIGKRAPITKEWQSVQLLEMELILRAKLEQVPQFEKELKSTTNHHLVENARSHFWGSGTYYNAPSIYSKNYPGLNHMGRLLEKIRDLY